LFKLNSKKFFAPKSWKGAHLLHFAQMGKAAKNFRKKKLRSLDRSSRRLCCSPSARGFVARPGPAHLLRPHQLDEGWKNRAGRFWEILAMLIAAEANTFLVLTIEHGGVEYSIFPHQSRAHVPAELGRALEEAKLAIIDAEARSPWWVSEDQWPQVTPKWETRH
jgi:hypothetical protein